MDGNLNNTVMCCFCGEAIILGEAVLLTVKSNYKNEEKQQLFSHKTCFVERMSKSVVLHPSFFDDDSDNH